MLGPSGGGGAEKEGEKRGEMRGDLAEFFEGDKKNLKKRKRKIKYNQKIKLDNRE